MKIAILTDTHFGHKNVVAYDQRDPEHETRMFAALDEMPYVDVLLHLGDVAFNEAESWHKRLLRQPAAKFWLVRGNHDGASISAYLKYGWDVAVDELALNRHGFRIHFTHKPLETVPLGTLNIHGHQHLSTHTATHMGLHLPDNNYKPFMLDTLLKQHRKLVAGKA